MKGFGNKKNNESKQSSHQESNIISNELISEAFKFHARGDILNEEKCYQVFLDKGFSDSRVFTNYGLICQQKGELDKAIELYTRAIELNPNNPFVYSNLGVIFNDQGDFRKAELHW